MPSSCLYQVPLCLCVRLTTPKQQQVRLQALKCVCVCVVCAFVCISRHTGIHEHASGSKVFHVHVISLDL